MGPSAWSPPERPSQSLGGAFMFTQETGYTHSLLVALTVAVVVAFLALAHAYSDIQIFG